MKIFPRWVGAYKFSHFKINQLKIYEMLEILACLIVLSIKHYVEALK